MLFLRINSTNLTKLLIKVLEKVCPYSFSFKTKGLSLSGMDGYTPSKCAVAKKDSSASYKQVKKRNFLSLII